MIDGERLIAVGSATTSAEYLDVLSSPAIRAVKQYEESLLDVTSSRDRFIVRGYCIPCDREVDFLVDKNWGGVTRAHGWTPNWRERLVCPVCQMNNRQRLIATLVKQEINDGKGKQQVYFMEQVTPIYRWAVKAFPNARIIGSEYLGHEYVSGQMINGIHHEDVENLSFPDGEFDLIVSNDVFEHVPHPDKAFAECARVLRPGRGVMLSTIPFHQNRDTSVTRASLVNGELVHVQPAAYHGNPVSADGSLVFTDFGWDLLEKIRTVGFSDVRIDVYASKEFGHLGGGQLVFCTEK